MLRTLQGLPLACSPTAGPSKPALNPATLSSLVAGLPHPLPPPDRHPHAQPFLPLVSFPVGSIRAGPLSQRSKPGPSEGNGPQPSRGWKRRTGLGPQRCSGIGCWPPRGWGRPGSSEEPRGRQAPGGCQEGGWAWAGMGAMTRTPQGGKNRGCLLGASSSPAPPHPGWSPAGPAHSRTIIIAKACSSLQLFDPIAPTLQNHSDTAAKGDSNPGLGGALTSGCSRLLQAGQH